MNHLTGTPKQIEWAERIRAEKLAELDTVVAEVPEAVHVVELYRGIMRAEPSAKAWIDHRDDEVTWLARQICPDDDLGELYAAIEIRNDAEYNASTLAFAPTRKADMTTITVTDIHTGQTATFPAADFAETVEPWFEDAPTDILDAIANGQHGRHQMTALGDLDRETALATLGLDIQAAETA